MAGEEYEMGADGYVMCVAFRVSCSCVCARFNSSDLEGTHTLIERKDQCDTVH
jgi:hypothetical protein